MLDAIVKWALGHRAAVVVLWGALLVGGLVAAGKANLEAFPDFAPPLVNVQTEAPGYSAEDVEAFITVPLEGAVGGTPGIETLRSKSVPGISVIEIVFKDGTDLLQARQLVAERLLRAQALLPDGVEAPSLEPFSAATGRLLVVGVTSKHASPLELRAAVEATLRPRLLAVQGVASAIVFGGGLERLEVTARPGELARRGVAWDDILDATKRATQITPAGFVDRPNERLHLLVDGRARSPEDLALVPVKVLPDGGRILLGDVAVVSSKAAPKSGDALLDRDDAVLLVLDKQPGANALATTLEAEKAIAEVAPLLPPGTIVQPDVFRQATYVESSVTNLRWALLEGALVVVLTLLLFLADPRACAISALAIPLSLLTAILVIVAWGATVNAMTLGGLAIAIGEVVDDAIIDVENVSRRMREARARGGVVDVLRVVLDASIEVRSAVVYATFVVAIAFLPLITMGGLHGKLFAPLGVAYLAAIGASLLCAITLTPVLAYFLIAGRETAKPETRLAAAMKRGYARLLEPLLERPALVGGAALVAILAALAAAYGFGGKLMPELNEGNLIVQVASLPGTPLETSRATALRLDEAILAIPGARHVGARIGRAELSEDTWDVENIEANVAFVSSIDNEETADRVTVALKSLKGVFASQKSYLTERIEEVISGETAAVALKIYGRDLEALDDYAARAAAALSAVPGARGVRQLPQAAGPPAARIRVRADSARRHGLSSGDVAGRVASMLRGVTVGRMPSRGISCDVVCRLDESLPREGKEGLGQIPVQLALGSIPLLSIADIDYRQARPGIFREGGVRKVTILCDVDEKTTDPEKFGVHARAALGKLGHLPAGVGRVEWAGEEAARHAAVTDLALKGLVALVIAFFVLQGALGSARLAGLVLTNLPFALVGGAVAVWLTGGVLTVGSYVGFVTIFGIASRNGVLLVAHLDHLVQREGQAWGREAVLRAAQERLLPIIMTASTAALGLLPIAISSGHAGGEIEFPMACVIFGGLFTSTALSLLVLPTLALRFGRQTAASPVQG